jgi:hypothetical protein
LSYFLVAQNFTKLEINFFKDKEKIIFNQKMLPYWVLRNMGLGSEIWKKLIPDPRGPKSTPDPGSATTGTYLNIEGVPVSEANVPLLVDQNLPDFLEALVVRLERLLAPLVLALHLLVHLLKLLHVLQP